MQYLSESVHGRRGSHFHCLVIIGEQMQNVDFVEQMQIVNFLFPGLVNWSVPENIKMSK